MAGRLLFIVVTAVVASVNAIPPPSLSPYRTFPSLAPYHFEQIHQDARGNFSIDPRKPGITQQPREPGITIMPRKPGITKQPRDTVVIKSRPLRYQPRAESELKCEKKNQVAKLKHGEVATFYSKNYPEKYSSKSLCKWKIIGQTETTNIIIDCGHNFKLQSSNKKGYCKDFLEIESTKGLKDRFCGEEMPPYTSFTNIVKMKFKSNKKGQFPGFICTATGYDANNVTTVAPTEAPTEATTVAPTEAPTEAPTCSCGRVNRATRIVGGVETEVNEYPWQVALVWSWSSTSSFCGGSIINEWWILTAAHCAEVMSPSNVIVAGEHSWSTQSLLIQKVGIEEILVHPNYGNYMENDVALIKLATPLSFEASNKVAPICPPSATDLYENVDAIVTGWGTTSSGGSAPDSLQEVVVPTMSNSECQSAYGSYITEDMICAGYPEGGKDSCQGDSGGPMITADGSFYRQIGVVSWGSGCASPGYPGVYARVNSQLEWIRNSISGTSWCEPGTVVTSGPINTTPKPVVTTVAPVSNECSCGRVNRANRIVGGVSTEVNEYPWMVALAAYESSSSAFCGGSIIHEYFVLTAAHCVAVMGGSEFVVVAEHDWSTSGESTGREAVTIAEIISHPSYNYQTMENDVALLKLSKPLTFGSDNKVAPICPPEAGDLYSNINAIVTGWGTTSSGGSLSDILLEVTVPTMPNSDCENQYGTGMITDDMICAGLPEGGKDACQGDSGGPMITQDSSSLFRQIGVVSWGYGCAHPDYPGVYARVTSQLNWISSQMPGSSWCSPGGTPVTPAPTVPPTGDCKCGRVNRQTRIVNGQETEVLEYPWQAGLVSYGGSRTWCGGSLINSKWVLTATHCTDGTSPSDIQVLLGEHTIYTTDGTEQRFDVSQVINHPSYITNPWTNGHDISLLELYDEVDFSSTLIRPICLPSTQDLFAGEQATVTGFGRTGANDDQSLVLMEVDIPVVTNDVCIYTYGSSNIDNTMICAGEGAGNGACMGDSGGPLITSVGDYHVQIGVVSFGSSNCDALGVYARVTVLQSWVEGYAMAGNAKVCTP